MRLYRQLNPEDPVIRDGSDRKTFERIVDDPMLHVLVLEEDHQITATTYVNIIPNLSRSAAPYAVVENVLSTKRFVGQVRFRKADHGGHASVGLGCWLLQGDADDRIEAAVDADLLPSMWLRRGRQVCVPRATSNCRSGLTSNVAVYAPGIVAVEALPDHRDGADRSHRPGGRGCAQMDRPVLSAGLAKYAHSGQSVAS